MLLMGEDYNMGNGKRIILEKAIKESTALHLSTRLERRWHGRRDKRRPCLDRAIMYSRVWSQGFFAPFGSSESQGLGMIRLIIVGRLQKDMP
jgi:hypothetical protein